MKHTGIILLHNYCRTFAIYSTSLIVFVYFYLLLQTLRLATLSGNHLKRQYFTEKFYY